jgi:hypothetical protein
MKDAKESSEARWMFYLLFIVVSDRLTAVVAGARHASLLLRRQPQL